MKTSLRVIASLALFLGLIVGAYFGPTVIAHAMTRHHPSNTYYRDPVRVADDLTRANHTPATRGGSFVADVPLDGSQVVGVHNGTAD